MEKLKLPIGVEDFAEFKQKNFYYVDKTGMIAELLKGRGKVNLFTRPRRFGKSLNMSMLKYFFELGTDATLFDGLSISEESGLCEEYLGKYPVISITLKATDSSSFETSRKLIAMEISEEARRMEFLETSERLSESDKKSYAKLLQDDMDPATLYRSLKTLSGLLRKHYGKNVIILIDEYDVPLAKASSHGYYKAMVELIWNLFESALKTNPALEFVFDEPTIGLHPLDVRTLLGVFRTLMENGATVVVIEHDLDVIRNADYVIDMGPGGGTAGGRIVACGTPDDIRAEEESITGKYL